MAFTISPAAASILNTAEASANLLSNSVTALAVLVGGCWAYFKFAKGRTLRVRGGIDISGTWCLIEGRHLLKLAVKLTNHGSSKLAYLSDGTYFQISKLAPSQEEAATGPVTWEIIGQPHQLFVWSDADKSSYSWNEPGETVGDEFLLDLRTSEPLTTMIYVRVVYRNWRGTELISSRAIIPADVSIDEKASTRE